MSKLSLELSLLFILSAFNILSAQVQTKKDTSFKDWLIRKDIKKFQLLIRPQYNLQEQLFILNPDYSNEGIFEDEILNTYKKGINQLLSIGYKDLTKYDLGLIGKYLGISKNILAIILAILSTM